MRFTCPITGLHLDVAAAGVLLDAPATLADVAEHRAARIIDRALTGRWHDAAEEARRLARILDNGEDRMYELAGIAYAETGLEDTP